MPASSHDAPAIALVVLFGGRSAEHDVSCVTAAHVLAALDRARYEIVAIGIDRSGTWHEVAGALATADAGGPLAAEGPAVDPLQVLDDHGDRRTVVLPLLHGPFGEDGTVQGLLEMADVAYVGSGVLGSALAMDKVAAKDVAAAHDLAQARWCAERGDQWDGARADAVVERLGLPLFVKPANMGSSIGVSRAASREELDEAVAQAARYDEVVVIEESIESAREIEVAVLGDLDLRTAPPGEVRPAAAFYDYDDKYTDGVAELLIPAPLPAELAEEIRSLAVRAARALHVSGLARVDFLYEEDGRGALLNEVNTMPGFTPISMYPKMWAAAGLPYGALLDELVAHGIARHERRARHRRTT